MCGELLLSVLSWQAVEGIIKMEIEVDVVVEEVDVEEEEAVVVVEGMAIGLVLIQGLNFL